MKLEEMKNKITLLHAEIYSKKRRLKALNYLYQLKKHNLKHGQKIKYNNKIGLIEGYDFNLYCNCIKKDGTLGKNRFNIYNPNNLEKIND
jgi:hypothetical protein